MCRNKNGFVFGFGERIEEGYGWEDFFRVGKERGLERKASLPICITIAIKRRSGITGL